jgi:polar amino acid transport system substrate-binding protein
VGDSLLTEAAKRINGLLRDSDTLARSAADEFLLLLPQVASMRDAIAAGDRILNSLRQPWEFDGGRVYITASLGLAVYPVDAQEGSALLENAHTAMRRAKKMGGDTQQFFDRALGEVAAQRLLRESELRTALEKRQFVVHYQPLIDTRDGTIAGVEALVRWQHPTLGLLLPDEFIAMAEETGVIVPMGEQVLGEACAQAADWQGLSRSPLRVAVNLSARQLREPNLLEVVEQTLAASGLAPELLDVEITETAAIGDAEGTTRVLRQLRDMGVGVSLDDFGTGYSSLSYLPRLPIARLKIDRSFVRDLPHDASSAAVVCAVIDLANTLGLGVTAEGVEREEQLEFLQAHRCHEVQGYLFSTPLAPEQCRQFLLKGLRVPTNPAYQLTATLGGETRCGS